MSETAVQSEPDADVDADGAERRRHIRIALPLKARFLTADGVEQNCLVVNISAGGALFKAKTPPPENCTVVLYIDQIGRFEGRVVRSGRHSFAVDYRTKRGRAVKTADALMEAMNLRGPRHDRRLAPRIRHESHAVVILESGVAIPCSILDISLTGASIEIEPRPALGTTLTLGKMAAKVVRRHDKGVGVVFSGPAQRMDDAIDQVADPDQDGAGLARGFGRRGISA